jgi:hypothetical protein
MSCKFIPAAAVVLFVALAGCQKVISLNVNNAAEKYVIEGNVTNLPGPYTVTFSQTDNVFDDYSFKGVSQAKVVINDDAGNSEILREMQPGIYQTAVLAGVEGRTYHLSITVEGQSFTSSSTMPRQVNLDSLYAEDLLNGAKTVKVVVPVFTDPPEKGNCYRINQYINGTLDKTLYYENDDFINGQKQSQALERPSADSTLHSGDRVDVEMQCIDYPMYKYWYSADLSSAGNGSNVPANPVTNIQGGALGYFSAHTSQTRSIMVK